MDLQEVVNSASGRYRLDPDLVNSVIKAESGFNVHAVSPKGAQGLMQLMPGTASQLGVPNAFDPQANVEGGTKYLRELLERYNFDLVKALAAYNAGPQRVEQFGGVPPYYETRAYVARWCGISIRRRRRSRKRGPAARRLPRAKRQPSQENERRQTPGSAAQAQVAQARHGSTASSSQSESKVHCGLRRPCLADKHRSTCSGRGVAGIRSSVVHIAAHAFDPFGSVIYLGNAVSRFALLGPRRGVLPFMDKKRILASVVVFLILAILVYLQYRHWRTFDWGTFWSQTHRIKKVHVLHGIALIYLALRGAGGAVEDFSEAGAAEDDGRGTGVAHPGRVHRTGAAGTGGRIYSSVSDRAADGASLLFATGGVGAWNAFSTWERSRS